MTKRPIAWEPHPVTPGRKAELVKAGFQIVDAAFAPPPELLQTVRSVSGEDSGGGPLAVISKSDFNPEVHAVHHPEAEAAAAAEAERMRLQAEAEAAQKAEAERLAAIQQPEAAQAAEAPAPATAAASARKRAGSTTPTTEA